MNRKGLSGIITTLIMIVLTVAATAIVWGVVNGILEERISTSSSCFKMLDKIFIENRYTCYDETASVLRFQLGVKDITFDGLLIAVSGNTESRTFTLTNDPQDIVGLSYYDTTGSVKLPNQNEGKTYNLTWNSGNPNPPNLIRIAPIANEKQCETIDTLTTIDNCNLLA